MAKAYSLIKPYLLSRHVACVAGDGQPHAGKESSYNACVQH